MIKSKKTAGDTTNMNHLRAELTKVLSSYWKRYDENDPLVINAHELGTYTDGYLQAIEDTFEALGLNDK